MRKFISFYIFYLALFFFLVDYEPMRNFLHLEEFYNSAITQLSAWFIDLVGMQVGSSSNVLHLPHANLIIKFGCNGLEAILIYAAGVLAYPAKTKTKILWIAIGTIFLEAINILRIALLAFTIEKYPKIFDIMHDYITQSIMIILAFLLFLFYLQRTQRAK